MLAEKYSSTLDISLAYSYLCIVFEKYEGKTSVGCP